MLPPSAEDIYITVSNLEMFPFRADLPPEISKEDKSLIVSVVLNEYNTEPYDLGVIGIATLCDGSKVYIVQDGEYHDFNVLAWIDKYGKFSVFQPDHEGVIDFLNGMIEIHFNPTKVVSHGAAWVSWFIQQACLFGKWSYIEEEALLA